MKNKKDLVELNKVETTEKNRPDEIFICSGSPEERCLGIIRRLSPKYKAQNVFILSYSDHESKKRENHLKEIRKRLENVGEKREYFIDEDKPIPILNIIIQEIEEIIKDDSKAKISFDISTIIKWHLLYLFKGVDLKNVFSNIRFLYTEPEDYITDLFQPLSFGIRDVFPIPTFYGNYDFSKESLLAIFLGYEGDRAVALLEEVDPEDCLLFIPKPAYHREWEGRTEEMNKEIINMVGSSKIKYIDSRSPVKVANEIDRILSLKSYEKYNHIISPLGTKPQTLGLYLYMSSNPINTILIYGAPLRHNELFYSKGIGRSWILPAKKIKK